MSMGYFFHNLHTPLDFLNCRFLNPWPNLNPPKISVWGGAFIDLFIIRNQTSEK